MEGRHWFVKCVDGILTAVGASQIGLRSESWQNCRLSGFISHFYLTFNRRSLFWEQTDFYFGS